MTVPDYVETEEKVWSLPDWAPKDTGDILYQDGNWIFIRDYLMDTREPFTTAVHLCNGEKWMPYNNPSQLINGECNKCREKAPEAFEGFFQMLTWIR